MKTEEDLLDTEVAVPDITRFGQILNALQRGPQCPCGIALDTSSKSEGEIYPYLAELLARRWVSLMPDQTSDKRLSELIDRTAALTVSANPNDPASVRKNAKTWYQLFRSLESEIPGDLDRILYVGLTPSGLSVSERLQGKKPKRVPLTPVRK